MKTLVTLYETDPKTGRATSREVELIVGANIPGELRTVQSLPEAPNSPYHHPPAGMVVVMMLVTGGRHIFNYSDEGEVRRLFLPGEVVVFDDQPNEIGDAAQRGHRSEKTGGVFQLNIVMPRERLPEFLKL